MGNRGHSVRGFGGRITHYDERGRKTGYSDPGIFGGYTNYDAKGHKTGRSAPALFGGYNHYDNRGHKTGSSTPNSFGGYTHYDSRGKRTGSSSQSVPGYYDNSEGCYIATCVYGSYDCPQVWTLRRFRDGTLRKTVPGRLFVRVYYYFSPKLVKRFGDRNTFRRTCRAPLDRLVAALNAKGVEDTPYYDQGKNHGN